MSVLPALAALERFYRETLGISGTIPLHEPSFRGNEWHYVKDCLDTTWVSSVGAYVDRFEQMCAARCGTRFAVATMNGTAALHAAFTVLGIGPRDLVVCPPLTFVATANAIVYRGAKPLFVDIEPDSLGLCPDALQKALEADTERRIKAVAVVHVFGHAARMDPIMDICARYDVPVVEDAAESLGSSHRGRPCGSIGNMGILSFNGNKTITTGAGGMIVTDDEALATRLKHLTTTARIGVGGYYDHDEIGFNYRLANLNAAVGVAQMESLDVLLASKRRLAENYVSLLTPFNDVSFINEPRDTRSNFWLNALLMKSREDRDEFLAAAETRGIQARPAWRLICDLEIYRDAPTADSLTTARDLGYRVVNIPSSPGLMIDAPNEMSRST